MDLSELLARYEALGEERDFLAAKPLFERAVAEREDARVLNGYGYLLECHGRNELRQAAALYERAIALDPEFDKPHYQLISARAGLREPGRAVSMYEERLASNPRGLHEHRFLAQAYIAAHSYAKAIEVAEAGLALAPDDATLIATRGEAKEGVGEVEGAHWRIGGVRSSWSRRTSALSTAVPSCSSARGGSPRRPMPGSRSPPGMRNAATSWRRFGRGRNSNACAPRRTHEATLGRMSDETEELWAKAAERIRSACGWSLWPLAQLEA
jgi:tetratricopeptide (TPR) repeat protein